jgi:hypothetical protein
VGAIPSTQTVSAGAPSLSFARLPRNANPPHSSSDKPAYASYFGRLRGGGKIASNEFPAPEGPRPLPAGGFYVSSLTQASCALSKAGTPQQRSQSTGPRRYRRFRRGLFMSAQADPTYSSRIACENARRRAGAGNLVVSKAT